MRLQRSSSRARRWWCRPWWEESVSAQGELCPRRWGLFALDCNANCPRLGAPASSRSHGASRAHRGVKTDETDTTARSTEPEGRPSPADASGPLPPSQGPLSWTPGLLFLSLFSAGGLRSPCSKQEAVCHFTFSNFVCCIPRRACTVRVSFLVCSVVC